MKASACSSPHVGSAWELMRSKDPSESNLFRFIEKHDGLDRAFLAMKKCLQKVQGRTVEEKLRGFEKNLEGMVCFVPWMCDAFSLRDIRMREKIIQDAHVYVTDLVEKIFSDTIDPQMTQQWKSEIGSVVAEAATQAVEYVAYLFAEQLSEKKIFACQKVAQGKCTISLVPILHPLSENQKRTIKGALERAALSDSDREKFLYGYEHGWKGFVRQSSSYPGIMEQIHGIRKVKIYKNCEGGIVVDIALSRVGEGASKAAKKEIKILPDGSICDRVRYTPKKASDGKKILSLLKRFHDDMNKELSVRAKLGQVPFLLDVCRAGAYVDKINCVKERFEASLCAGSLAVFTHEKRLSPEQVQQALRCVVDALRALCFLHDKKYVHRDLNLGNILYMADERGVPIGGRLSDLGFCSGIDDTFLHCGTPESCPPEIFLPATKKNDPSMDMFSVGTLLLIIYKPNFREELDRLQGGLLGCNGYSSLFPREYREGLQKLSSMLSTKDELEAFIAKLLDYNPQGRPSCIETLQQLERFLEGLSAPQAQRQKP